MINKKRIVKDLMICCGDRIIVCSGCTYKKYGNKCTDYLLKDAAELLSELEEIEPDYDKKEKIMTVNELKEMLDLFDGDQEIMWSDDTVRCKKLHGLVGVRKVQKDDNGTINEDSFVAIN